MPTVREVEKALYELAPRDLAQNWDNVGLLVGDPDREVTAVLVALDVTQAVTEEAEERGCDLIVAHHPLMNCTWSPVQSVRTDHPQGRLITTLIQNEISAICMHTNLDSTQGGVNDALARRVGFTGRGAIGRGRHRPHRRPGEGDASCGICCLCQGAAPGRRRPVCRRWKVGPPGGSGRRCLR